MGHPEIVGRSCEDCKEWLYEDYSDRLSNQVKRGSRKEKLRRPKGAPTPCWICPKIPRDAAEKKPENAIELSDKNWQCLVWYYEVRAAGMSDAEKADSVCRRNMGIIDPIVRRHEIESGTMKAIAAIMKARG